MNFSVVIPLFNKAAYVGRTIDSVLCQTHSDFELVVVDDGSTDDSIHIVEQYSDSRIRLVKKSNGGEGSARNAGVDAAKNELICFLDADDEWAPWFLEEIHSLVSRSPNAVLYATAFSVKEQDGSLRQYFHDGIGRNLANNGILNYLGCLAEGQFAISSSSVCVKKRAMQAVGAFDESLKIGADIHTWIRVCFLGHALYSARPSAVYRRDAEGRSIDQSGLHGKRLAFLEKLIVLQSEAPQGGDVLVNLRRFIAFKAYELAVQSTGHARLNAIAIVNSLRKYLPLQLRINLTLGRSFR